MDELVDVRAVARVRLKNAGTTPIRATGFLVADRYLLTALHVIADKQESMSRYTQGSATSLDTGPIIVEFDDAVLSATVVDGCWNPQEDWALLEVDGNPDAHPIPMGALPQQQAPWIAHAYPMSMSDRIVLGGNVVDVNAVINDVPLIQLFSPQTESSRELIPGISGSPCIVDNVVVGVINAERKGSTLYAAPIEQIVTQCRGLLAISSDGDAGEDSRILETLQRMGAASIPAYIDGQNLRVASWNLDDEGRSDYSIRLLAAVMRLFDVVVFSQVSGDLKDLTRIQATLGAGWGGHYSAETDFEGKRRGFLYRSDRLSMTRGETELMLESGSSEYAAASGRPLEVATFQAGDIRFVAATMLVGMGSNKQVQGMLAALSEAVVSWRDQAGADAGPILLFGQHSITDPKLSASLDKSSLKRSSALEHITSTILTAEGPYPLVIDGIIGFEDESEIMTGVGGVIELGAEGWEALFQQQDLYPLEYKKLIEQTSDHLPIWIELQATRTDSSAYVQTDYASDSANTEDLLNIKNDVDAFARLIAAKNVDPPLSIGLFGDWGSGKTFFMNRLRERVAAVSKGTRMSEKPQRDVAYYKHIAQIEFNAWHYVEGSLWASLVTHIFDNLAVDPEDKPDELEQRQKWLLGKLKELEERVERASEEQKQLERSLGEMQKALHELDKAANKESVSLTMALGTLKELGKELLLEDLELGLKERTELRDLLGDVNQQIADGKKAGSDFYTALNEARNAVESSGKVLAPLIHSKDKGRRALHLFALVIAVPGLAATALWTLADIYDWSSILGQLGPALAAVMGWLGTGADWVRRQTMWVADWQERANMGQQIIMRRLDAENAPRRAKKLEVEAIRATIQELGSSRAQTRAEIAELKETLERTTPGHLLKEFIRERAGSDDYRKHLGIPALIRRDFAGLSTSIGRLNRALEDDPDAEKKQPSEIINRIVLYVDDLDRCPVPTVVKVLEAVHLLLAFPLFVVVVGVDARWTYQCLRTYYEELLQGGDSATPHDYLEKIFQIPFWIRPMGVGGRAGMIDGLTVRARGRYKSPAETPAPGATAQLQPTPAPSPEPTPQLQPAPAQSSATTPQPQPIPAPSATPTPRPQPLTKPKTEEKLDLNPASLTIVPQEHRFMRELTPLLGRSPRALKRFVNVYRLIKSGLSEGEHKSFVEESEPCPRYKAVMFLLVVIAGMPSLSQDFFEILQFLHEQYREDDNVKPPTLKTLMPHLEDKHHKLESPDDFRRLGEWLNGNNRIDDERLPPLTNNTPHPTDWESVPLASLANDAALVARYSFRVKAI